MLAGAVTNVYPCCQADMPDAGGATSRWADILIRESAAQDHASGIHHVPDHGDDLRIRATSILNGLHQFEQRDATTKGFHFHRSSLVRLTSHANSTTCLKGNGQVHRTRPMTRPPSRLTR
jgi:hypothetical protein